MLIRLALLLSILLIVSSAAMYALTRDPRYPRFIRQVVRFVFYTLLVFGVFSVIYLGEAIRWNHVAAFACLVFAAIFAFGEW